mgnify:CR=1 FL=1
MARSLRLAAPDAHALRRRLHETREATLDLLGRRADVVAAARAAGLDQILSTLKTRGRARFNVRAWQLDLAKHEIGRAHV